MSLKSRKAKYQANNKDKVKKWQANYRAKKKLEDEKMGKISKAAGRVAKTHPYRDSQLTIKEALALPECTYSRAKVTNGLNAGKTLEEIIWPPTKEEKAELQKLTKIEAAKQRALDRQAVKDAKDDVKRQRALKIMSVPINIKKTAEYYVMLAYKHRSGDNMDSPIQLRDNGGW